MMGPKRTAMILFGALGGVFGALFAIGLNNAFGALATGVIAAGLTGTFIWFARTGHHAFARGFLGLGAVFIVIPFAVLAGFGAQVAEGSIAAIQSSANVTEEEATALFLSSIFVSAGLVFGIVVGVVLVLIGGLMHRRPPAPETAAGGPPGDR